MSIASRLMQTESPWNPKVILGRMVARILPTATLHSFKRHYYAYLLRHERQEWAERDQVVVGHLIAPGDVVIDIGASIGGYTKYLSTRVGTQGCVYSFEPNPEIFDFLSHNVKILKLSNVEIFNVAISDRAGSAQLSIPRYRWGSECHYDATLENTADSRCRSVSVPTATLDSLLGDKNISFIKCDVNYHELPCLLGAKSLLERCNPGMLIEIFPDPDTPTTTAYQAFALMQGMGYQAYWFDGTKLRLRLGGEKSQNYFFLTAKHLPRLAQFGV